MTKYKIILCVTVVLALAIPVFSSALINGFSQIHWYDYLLIFLIAPILTWLTVGFSIRKYKEQLVNEK